MSPILPIEVILNSIKKSSLWVSIHIDFDKNLFLNEWAKKNLARDGEVLTLLIKFII